MLPAALEASKRLTGNSLSMLIFIAAIWPGWLSFKAMEIILSRMRVPPVARSLSLNSWMRPVSPTGLPILFFVLFLIASISALGGRPLVLIFGATRASCLIDNLYPLGRFVLLKTLFKDFKEMLLLLL